MYYVYVLRSVKDKGFYIGFTSDVERRLCEHRDGCVDATQHRLPVDLCYIEGYQDERSARHMWV